MFCKSCGAKLEDGAKFCPSCGTAASENADIEKKEVNVEKKQETNFALPKQNLEVYIRGFKCAGEDASKYYAFTYYFPLIPFFIGLFFYYCDLFGLGIFIMLLAVAVVVPIRTVFFKRSILYNETEKKFVFNEHARLKFAKKEINLSEIKKIRYRNVKIGFGMQKASLNDFGKFSVISFDGKEKSKGLSVFFPKKGNAEEFLPTIEYAIKSNGLTIEIDKKEEQMKYAEWFEETAITRGEQ